MDRCGAPACDQTAKESLWRAYSEIELDVQRQEHDLGEYPTVVLTWEDAMRGAPWEYIERWEKALTEYENPLRDTRGPQMQRSKLDVYPVLHEHIPESQYFP